MRRGACPATHGRACGAKAKSQRKQHAQHCYALWRCRRLIVHLLTKDSLLRVHSCLFLALSSQLGPRTTSPPFRSQLEMPWPAKVDPKWPSLANARPIWAEPDQMLASILRCWPRFAAHHRPRSGRTVAQSRLQEPCASNLGTAARQRNNFGVLPGPFPGLVARICSATDGQLR